MESVAFLSPALTLTRLDTTQCCVCFVFSTFVPPSHVDTTTIGARSRSRAKSLEAYPSTTPPPSQSCRLALAFGNHPRPPFSVCSIFKKAIRRGLSILGLPHCRRTFHFATIRLPPTEFLSEHSGLHSAHLACTLFTDQRVRDQAQAPKYI